MQVTTAIRFFLPAFCLMVVPVGPRAARAEILLSFLNGDTLDGDVADDLAGPFTDAITGAVGTITTVTVAPSGKINTTEGSFGINAAGSSDQSARFDDLESWTFHWDIATSFMAIDFGRFSTSSESFVVESVAWQGLPVAPGSGEVAFASSTGTFVFSSGTQSDRFDLTDISGGVPLPLSSGVDLLIRYRGEASDNATLSSLTFGTFSAVPEPSSLILSLTALLAVVACAGLVQTRRKKGG